MNVFIAGATGFLGSQLREFLSRRKFNVFSLSRSDFELPVSDFFSTIKDANVIINLAGYPINSRWNKRNMELMHSSRVDTVVKFLSVAHKFKNRNVIYIGASAIGIYDYLNVHDEGSNEFSEDFLGALTRRWERNTLHIRSYFPNTYILRLGVVLHPEGGFLREVIRLSRFGFFPYSANNPKLSFIHLHDFLDAILHLIDYKPDNTIFNFVTPFSTNFSGLFDILKSKYKFLPLGLPPVFFRIMFGKRHVLFTRGQSVYPRNLLESGYRFKYPSIVNTINSF